MMLIFPVSLTRMETHWGKLSDGKKRKKSSPSTQLLAAKSIRRARLSMRMETSLQS